MLNGAMPIFTAVVSTALLRELPGQRQTLGLLVGFALIYAGVRLAAKAKAEGDTVYNINLDLPGNVQMDTMKCLSCGSPLSPEDIKMVNGAPVVTCPSCGTTYNLTEEPKW